MFGAGPEGPFKGQLRVYAMTAEVRIGVSQGHSSRLPDSFREGGYLARVLRGIAKGGDPDDRPPGAPHVSRAAVLILCLRASCLHSRRQNRIVSMRVTNGLPQNSHRPSRSGRGGLGGGLGRVFALCDPSARTLRHCRQWSEDPRRTRNSTPHFLQVLVSPRRPDRSTFPWLICTDVTEQALRHHLEG